MNEYDGTQLINIGTGKDITIADLALCIKDVVGYEGDIVYDDSKPDGKPRKLLNVDRMRSLGWSARTSLQEGLKKTIEWCIQEGLFTEKDR